MTRGLRRHVLWIVIISILATLPMLAEEPAKRLCPGPGPNGVPAGAPYDPTYGVFRGTGGYQPLPANLRLRYGLGTKREGVLEIQFHLNGDLYITEIVDLAKVELPRTAERKPKGKPAGPASEYRGILRNQLREIEQRQVRSFLQRDRVMDLLALYPDQVRDLHRLAAENATIEVRFTHDGKWLETLSFADLTRRSAELRTTAVLPVVAFSDVRGPGIVRKAQFTIETHDILENCWECTEDMPCDTECGWDEGKGGPTTCGEYGAPCEPWCAPSWTHTEYWTNWYYDGAGYTGWIECFQTHWGISRWHEEWVTVYRRDRVRQTMNCPNSPSCDGCYITEEIVGYQLWGDYCYFETSSQCYNGWMPCCGQLCNVYSWTLCDNDWPC